MKFINGDIYEGDFINNQIEGIGKFKYANGDSYRGEVKNSMRSGKGIMKMYNGDIYDGEFKENKKHGFGSFIYISDYVYQQVYNDENMASYAFSCLQKSQRIQGIFKNLRKEESGWFHFIEVNRENDLLKGTGVVLYDILDNNDEEDFLFGEFICMIDENKIIIKFLRSNTYNGFFNNDLKQRFAKFIFVAKLARGKIFCGHIIFWLAS